jgi:Domain of unknown function (DUF5134)
MLAVAAVSAARLVAARVWRGGPASADTDIAHLLMALAMAGMLASSLTTLPAGAWEAIFGLLTAWFAVRVVRDARAEGTRALASGHCAPHLVHSAAMLYMFLALGAPVGGGMSGMSGPGTQTLEYPTLAFAFALTLAGYSVWDIDQLAGERAVARAAGLALAGAALAGVPVLAGAESGPVRSASAVDGRPADDHTIAERPADGVGGAALLSPGVTMGCRIAMGVTMAFMLIIMI